MKKNLIGIDIFCGAGGLTNGLKKAGINVKIGVDLDKSVEQTYTRNNPNTQFLNKDIKKVTPEELLKDIDRSTNLLVLAGCAPCQPFSRQNTLRKRRDSRRSLIVYFAKLIGQISPDYILVENVSGFMKKTNIYRRVLLKILRSNGYNYEERVINAADYGVPQKRQRYILIASKIGPISLPSPGFGPKRLPYVTVGDTIRKYPKIIAGQTVKNIPNHQSRLLSEMNLMRIKSIPKNGGSRSSFPDNLVLKCHSKHKGHSDVYGRMRWDEPAPTLTCKCTSITNGRFGHPDQNRAITAREAAALQTFGDDYVFYGNFTEITRQIGNSVPVLLAEKLGKAIVKHAHKA